MSSSSAAAISSTKLKPKRFVRLLSSTALSTPRSLARRLTPLLPWPAWTCLKPPRSSSAEVESVDISEEFAHEKLSPVLAMYHAKTFDEAIEKAEHLIADGGYGHTSSLYINVAEKEKMAKHQAAMKTCRILVNTPSSQAVSATCTTSNWLPPLPWAAVLGAVTPFLRTWVSST